MTSIYTNMYESFTSEVKEKLTTKYKRLGIGEIGPYSEKSLDEGVSKFVLKDLDIMKYVAIPSRWNDLVKLVKDLYFTIRSTDSSKTEIQMWLIDVVKKPSLNIAFSLQDWTDISMLMNTLHSTLVENKSDKNDKGIEIVWVSYDQTLKSWSIKKL